MSIAREARGGGVEGKEGEEGKERGGEGEGDITSHPKPPKTFLL